jgi:hypothetical protein
MGDRIHFINFHSRRRYWSELFNNANAIAFPFAAAAIASIASYLAHHLPVHINIITTVKWDGLDVGVRVTFPPPGKQMMYCLYGQRTFILHYPQRTSMNRS